MKISRKNVSRKMIKSCLVVSQSMRRAFASIVVSRSCSDVKSDKIYKDFEFNKNYVNGNPRNLEWSGHAYKRRGWHLHYPPKDYYHRIFVDFSGKRVIARVEHYTGKTVLSVSSDAPEIKKHLFSTQDSSAVYNVARVLAERCLQFGLNQLNFFKDQEFDTSKRMQLFYKTLIDNGLKLEEPEFIEDKRVVPGLDYEEKDFYNEPLNLPFPPDVNRLKKKLLQE